MQLTKRDEALFRELGKYGLLTTTQLSRRIFPEVQNSTVLRRLRALEEAKWIYRTGPLDSGELVWILSRKGEERLGISTPMIHPNRSGLAHDVLLTDFRMSLEAIGLGENFIPEWTVRRMTYNPDRRGRESGSIVPDGIFSALSWQGNVITVALELELHAKNLTRYEKIFSRYMSHDRLSLVWYFVKTEAFGLSLMRTWGSVAKRNFRQDESLVFTVISDFEQNAREAKIHFMSGGTNRIEEYFMLPHIAPESAQVVGTLVEEKNQSENLKTAS